MNINERILNFIDILGDLDNISKKLYLESPETWIDFSDKVSEQNIDEMVLFYASKYNYVSVLKFVEENKIINLDGPSRNKQFSSIRNHLIAVSRDYNSIDTYNYLIGNYEEQKDTSEIENNSLKEQQNINSYTPVFLCPHCSSNVFQSGYKIFEEISYSFSKEKNKSKEISRQRDSRVFCCNCNYNIDNVSIELLENLCSIHNCKKCGNDLTEIGIDEKIKMIFDDKNKKFTSSIKTYNCPSCQEELNEYQAKYFNLV
ncbi:hypothetical protein H9L25_06380 [Terrisporobacter mayombei]|nr:hypothetical protein [Terrisporobacter mayombei]